MREVQEIFGANRAATARLAGLLVSASLLFGIVFAFLGIYDTSGVSFFKRVVFWFVTTFTGTVCAWFLLPLFPATTFGRYGYWLRIAPIALVVSLPVTVVLTIFNPNFDFGSSLLFWLRQYGLVVPISILVVAIGHMLAAFVGNAQADEIRPGTGTLTRQIDHPFFARLPIEVRTAKLYAISAEDHYLRVYTSRGESLILMRLTDAIVELGDRNGAQVHRSWWVAADGIQSSLSKNGRKYLVLKSGVEVPISRTYSKAAKDAGLL